MTPSHDAVHARACENCQTPLQGGFCHVCGQNAHNPLRSFGHAVEEVFESFWHLDGRIFRTLRTLLSPGRLANAYLAGHRAPYVAPLRLFVILSVLTFFVDKFAMGSGDVLSPPAVADGKGGTTVQVTGAGGEGVDFASLTDPDEVVRLRDRTIAARAHEAARGAIIARANRAVCEIIAQVCAGYADFLGACLLEDCQRVWRLRSLLVPEKKRQQGHAAIRASGNAMHRRAFEGIALVRG